MVEFGLIIGGPTLRSAYIRVSDSTTHSSYICTNEAAHEHMFFCKLLLYSIALEKKLTLSRIRVKDG